MNFVRKIQIVSAGLLAVATLTACDAEDISGELDASVEDGEVADRFGIIGGKTRNTNIVGYTNVSQVPRIGDAINGVKLTRVYLPLLDRDLEHVWADPDGALYGLYDETVYTLEYFGGAEFHISIDGDVPETGVFTLYDHFVDAWGNNRYEFRDITKLGADLVSDAPPTCQGDENDLVDALIVPSMAVDEEARVYESGGGFFIACANGAMGKVMLEELGWGYKPYEIGFESYTAAVRTARADYCGDGRAWTLPGQALELDDTYGVNSYSPTNLHERVEAIWTPEGASCWVPKRRRVIDAGGYDGPTPDCDIPKCPVDSKASLLEFYGYYGELLSAQ